jgi:hypothetical protein
MIFYGIDCLVITPIALLFFPVREVGLVHSYLYDKIGIASFYLFYIFVFTPLILLVLNLIKKSKLILFTFTITTCFLMFITIIHNLMVIWALL